MKIKIILMMLSFLCTYQPVKAAANSTNIDEVQTVYAVAFPILGFFALCCAVLKLASKNPTVSYSGSRPAPAAVPAPVAVTPVLVNTPPTAVQPSNELPHNALPPSYEKIAQGSSTLPTYCEACNV